MSAVVPYIRAANRVAVGRYLIVLHFIVAELTFSLRPPETQAANADILHKFEPFVTYEEKRIQSSLERVEFNLDAIDAVHVIAGSERLEAVSGSTGTLKPSR